jgi:hypothetical protein
VCRGGRLRAAALRLLREDEIRPHLIALAMVRVAGELGAGASLAGRAGSRRSWASWLRSWAGPDGARRGAARRRERLIRLGRRVLGTRTSAALAGTRVAAMGARAAWHPTSCCPMRTTVGPGRSRVAAEHLRQQVEIAIRQDVWLSR